MRYILLLCIGFVYLFADAHVLLYHRFNDTRYPSTSTTNEDLKNQFKYLKDNNYTVVKLSDIVEKLSKNETIPNKWVALAIDDSYKSFYENGYEIFKEFNYPFTMFVYVEGTHNKYPDFMSWSELKEVADLGVLQYHSYAHPSMPKLSDEELKKDFDKGLELFEKNLGFKPKYFSYPYGEMNDRTAKLIKAYDFEAIFNQNNGAITNKSDINNLDRLAVVGSSDIKSLLSMRYLKASWSEPKIYPQNSTLNSVIITDIDTNKTKAQLYVTDIGWMDVEINNGTVSKAVDQNLTRNRVRVILKVGNQVSTKILTRGEK